eukprot:9705381-Prorocentrum_lima.AAC.1
MGILSDLPKDTFVQVEHWNSPNDIIITEPARLYVFPALLCEQICLHVMDNCYNKNEHAAAEAPTRN